MTYQFRVASPCSANWSEMKGDNRVRYCEHCRLNVYNFTAMTPAEIDRLIREHERRLCGRIYERTDGTSLTRNCPVGFRSAVLRASGFAAATLSSLLSLAPRSSAQSPQKIEEPAAFQTVLCEAHLAVVDSTGAVIPGAHVTFKNEATGNIQTFVSDDVGHVKANGLMEGAYEITVFMLGFATRTLTHYAVPSSEVKKISLEVGGPTNVGVVVVGELTPQRHNPIKAFFVRVRRLV